MRPRPAPRRRPRAPPCWRLAACGTPAGDRARGRRRPSPPRPRSPSSRASAAGRRRRGRGRRARARRRSSVGRGGARRACTSPLHDLAADARARATRSTSPGSSRAAPSGLIELPVYGLNPRQKIYYLIVPVINEGKQPVRNLKGRADFFDAQGRQVWSETVALTHFPTRLALNPPSLPNKAEPQPAPRTGGLQLRPVLLPDQRRALRVRRSRLHDRPGRAVLEADLPGEHVVRRAARPPRRVRPAGSGLQQPERHGAAAAGRAQRARTGRPRPTS